VSKNNEENSEGNTIAIKSGSNPPAVISGSSDRQKPYPLKVPEVQGA
jgi:hypothetical protein